MTTYPTVGRCEGAVHQLKQDLPAILPRIVLPGRVYFCRAKDPMKKEERLAEMVAMAWMLSFRLMERGWGVRRLPGAAAAFATRAVRSGLRLCGRRKKAKDAPYPPSRQRPCLVVRPPPEGADTNDGVFDDAPADNTVTPVDEQVAFRLDFPQWLSTYSDRDRRIALDLMVGERTMDVSEKYALSAGRVSQMRTQFHDSWKRFQDTPAG